MPEPSLIDALTSRGLLAEATPGLAERLTAKPITGYVGFDPTSDSLHVGNLIPVMSLVWLQRTGGTPIALVGGGTGLVGDPSGKRNERPMLSPDQVETNVAGIRKQLEHFLDFEGPNAARLRNNADWLTSLGLLEFLRDTGKHFTVNYMLQKESVKSRMETGISFTEFTYMLVQAYDFWYLNQHEGCELQLGGTDQWGNITAGLDLIARRVGGSAHGLVLPLLTTSTGAKFGKSEGGNVWLDPAKTSPYKFYQFWLNAEDADVEKLIKFFTIAPLDEISDVMRVHAADPGKRAAQRYLARDVTTRVHGSDTAGRVMAASEILFGGSAFRSADLGTLEVVAEEVPRIELPRSRVEGGVMVIDALVESGLASSKADARRGIQQQGFSLNGDKISAVDRLIGSEDLLANRYVVLQKGRKAYAFLEVR